MIARLEARTRKASPWRVPLGSQQIDWSGGSGNSRRFTGGDNDTKYHITLDFTQPLLDKLNRAVPMNDCRKVYMVFAPRFEITEQELEDGCFLTAGVGANNAVWQVFPAPLPLLHPLQRSPARARTEALQGTSPLALESFVAARPFARVLEKNVPS